MKITTSLFKTMFLGVIVLAMAQSCKKEQLNKTETNTFDVNLFANNSDVQLLDPILVTDTNRVFDSTMVVIDNDSLYFGLICSSGTYPVFLGDGASKRCHYFIRTNSSGFEYLYNFQGIYNDTINAYESIRDLSPSNLINEGKLINNEDTLNKWYNFQTFPFITKQYTMIGEFYNASYGCYNFLCSSLNINMSYTLAKNTDMFMVLRKARVNTYVYYWIRVRRESNNSINILNGKYQIDSIITGQ